MMRRIVARFARRILVWSQPRPKEADRGAILDASLRLAETQLLAQSADETSLDGRTMGVLAFNGALLVSDIAAKTLLGTWWWAPLPTVGVASALCLRSIFVDGPDLGLEALTFYTTFGGQLSLLGREQLLVELDDAFNGNAKRIRGKSRFLRAALAILAVGIAVAALLIAIDRPSKVERHHVCSTRQCAHPADARAGSGRIWAAARRSWRHSQQIAA